MSSSNMSSTNSNKSVIEKAIYHAQMLRNKMAEAISSNDPFGSVFDVKHHNSVASEDNYSCVRITTTTKKYNHLSSHDQEKIHAFLKGNCMSKEDEFCAMELLKSLSADDLCRATESVYCSLHNKCICTICKAFNDENLKCDIKRTGDRFVSHNTCNIDKANSFIDDVKDKYRSYQYELFKYVDCIKVCIHSVYLTEVALQILSGSNDRKGHTSASANTYFLQYKIPEFLRRTSVKLKSKVNTGLRDPDLMKMCSRKLDDGAIHFKHIGIHDICSLEKFNLEDIEVTFQISCRTPKQKNTNILGYASFNFGLLEASKNLTCNRELIVKLKENSPVIVGTIKVSIQLGCGRLFFGKDFIDTLESNKENSEPLCSDEVSISDSEKILKRERESNNLSKKLIKPAKHVPSKKEQTSQTEQTVNKVGQPNKKVSCKSAEVQTENIYTLIQDDEKEVLIGFLYIAQAQFSTKPLNSYITCRLFGQHEASESRLIENTSNPIFNFCQVIPLVYEDNLLKTLQNNCMLIEIFEKFNSRDILIGVTKLPLQQFYLAYKNPVVVKYLKKNKLPIIGTDWWEPITLPLTDEVVGQIQVLTALGTEEQIENLELRRGFKALHVKANPHNYITSSALHLHRSENKIKLAKESVTVAMSGYDDNACLVTEDLGNKTDVQNGVKRPEGQKLDVGVQSDSTMDTRSLEVNRTITQGVLDMFLNKLISQRQKNICVENSTNTDDDKVNAMRTPHRDAQNATNLELRKTSDLLDSLQQALAVDSVAALPHETKKGDDVFKVDIKIGNGLHLPSRKKCKSKKSKNRGAKWEDILPSTYVTFETRDSNLHITKVCPKSTNPHWNYQETLNLPFEFLKNNQKRLIFKVWRKSTNTTTQPHMQTDVVLGFAALDLTVLTNGLPNVQGWFNIVDFSGKTNGQINIIVTPLENVSKNRLCKETYNNFLPRHDSVDTCSQTVSNTKRDIIAEEPGELLGRALKRKFSELDEITQRLRLRLSKVTNDESDWSNDELTEEFERDINTLCIEDDFDMVNFEDKSNEKSFSQSDLLRSGNFLEIKTSDPNCSSESDAMSLVSMETAASTTNGNISLPPTLKIDTQSNNKALNKDLLLGRQHIDALLDKLSALQTSDGNLILNKTSNVEEKTTSSADVSTFSGRFVSGCSANTEEMDSCIDTEAILKELDLASRPNIHSCSTYDPTVFQQIYNEDSSNSVDTCESKSNSETSIFTSCSRVAPDGAGTSADEKMKTTADI